MEAPVKKGTEFYEQDDENEPRQIGRVDGDEVELWIRFGWCV